MVPVPILHQSHRAGCLGIAEDGAYYLAAGRAAQSRATWIRRLTVQPDHGNACGCQGPLTLSVPQTCMLTHAIPIPSPLSSSAPFAGSKKCIPRSTDKPLPPSHPGLKCRERNWLFRSGCARPPFPCRGRYRPVEGPLPYHACHGKEARSR